MDADRQWQPSKLRQYTVIHISSLAMVLQESKHHFYLSDCVQLLTSSGNLASEVGLETAQVNLGFFFFLIKNCKKSLCIVWLSGGGDGGGEIVRFFFFLNLP